MSDMCTDNHMDACSTASDNDVKSIRVEVEPDQKMPDEMTPEEQEAFLNELVTRREAINFIQGYIGERIFPVLSQQLNAQYNSAYAMIHVLQTILVASGICTLEEIHKCYDDYVKQQKQKYAEQMEKQEKQDDR